MKQYFEKIKKAEAIPTERNMTIDKGAASRFIKAGLAGNEKFDLQKAEQLAKERARAHIKFNELQNKRQNSSSNEQPNPICDKQSSEFESILNSSKNEISTQTEPTKDMLNSNDGNQVSTLPNKNKRSQGPNLNHDVKIKKRSKKRKYKGNNNKTN